MHHQLLKQPSILTSLIIVCGIGLLLGIAIIWFPPYSLLVGIAGIVYLMVAWLRPEIAILGILVLTSTVFDMNLLPSISIGIGHILIPDILLFILFGIIFLRVISKSSSFIYTPLDIPLLAFYFTAILATAIGILKSRLTFNQSLGELRTINFFLTFFLVTNLVRNEKQLRRLYSGIVFLAIFVALAMITQSILGTANHILPGRVETLGTAGVISYGVTRILPPGQSLVLIIFICLVVQMHLNRNTSKSMADLILFGIVGFSVILTFNRSFWVAIVLDLAIVVFLVSFREKIRFTSILFGAALIGALILAPFLAINKGDTVHKVIDGIAIRMSSLINPNTIRESSLSYRYIENRYAYLQIESHALIGLGLGANYRPVDERINGTAPSYIHNGHLWVMLKTGLIGYLFFMWFLLMFSKRAFQNWKLIRDPTLRGIVLSFSVTIVGVLVATLVNPISTQPYWTSAIGIMIGIGEAILRLSNNQSRELQE